ncbi:MAG TPA: hypothetical protein VMI54_24855 [Polyangiaceae bacterium]|nr:hypothetical protein [Polyangiaceae bacterium]
MRSASWFSIFGMALGLSAAIVACNGDDDDKSTSGTPSGRGESCARTADCASGLVCVDDVCQSKAGSGAGGNAGNEGVGGSTGGTKATAGSGGTGTAAAAGKAGSAGSATAAPPVLGGEGESCTRAADCESGLHCFNQRCMSTETTGSGGEGGMGSNPPPSVRLGEQGETCTLSSDCVDGLACLPTQIGAGATAGVIGVCSVTSSGIQPTGMDCHAECKVPSDCCELPPSVLAQFDVKSCADLAAALSGVDCKDPGASAAECFAQAVYCQCTSDMWDCTDAGTCVYTATCTDSGLTTGGCPLKSRSDLALVSTCNSDGACAAPAGTAACTKDSQCEGKVVADSSPDTCTAGECTCYKAQGECYRMCASNLDCATDKTCDNKTHVCVVPTECSTNLECQTKHRNVDSICVGGSCEDKCMTDLDCNSLTGSLTRVCGSDNTCQAIGCSSDSDCTGTAVHMFCTDVYTADAGTVVSSAITQGGTSN